MTVWKFITFFHSSKFFCVKTFLVKKLNFFSAFVSNFYWLNAGINMSFAFIKQKKIKFPLISKFFKNFIYVFLHSSSLHSKHKRKNSAKKAIDIWTPFGEARPREEHNKETKIFHLLCEIKAAQQMNKELMPTKLA